MDNRTNGSAAVTKLNTAMREGKKGAQEFGSKVEGITRNVGEKIGELTSSITDSASEYVKEGREYIEKHPVRSVAIAVAAGAAVASLLSMILRNREE